MKYLKVFHRDILTVRSHQWKYYFDPYSRCAFRCTYCLYLSSNADGWNLRQPVDLLGAVEADISSMRKKQIIYLGATVDPYPMLEKEANSTRQILRALIRHELPVVILTKSPLILRDLDVLQEFNRRNLLLVQFTVLTTDQDKARVLERGAPSVAGRLRTAAKLASSGIPVHFHLSPVLPGIYDDGELSSTVQAIRDSGGQCVYSNILGMRYKHTRVLFESVGKLKPEAAARIRSEYRRTGAPPKRVYSPGFDLIYSEMSRLRDTCCRHNIDFICEFIPGLDVYDPARFERGIFRFGLPTVYQMTQFINGPDRHMDWRTFSERIAQRFEALDGEYLALLEGYWNDGQLFDNTTIGSEIEDGQRSYFRTAGMNSSNRAILSWD